MGGRCAEEAGAGREVARYGGDCAEHGGGCGVDDCLSQWYRCSGAVRVNRGYAWDIQLSCLVWYSLCCGKARESQGADAIIRQTPRSATQRAEPIGGLGWQRGDARLT